MKSFKYILWVICPLLVFSQESGQSYSEERFDYKVDGYVIMEKFDRQKKEIIFDGDKYEAGNFRYEKIGDGNYKVNGQDFNYVLIKILNFSRSVELVDGNKKLRFYRTKKEVENMKAKKPVTSVSMPEWATYKDSKGYYYKEIPNTTDYIDIGDQESIFWMKEEKFNESLEKGYIKKRFYLDYQVAYGASLSIPFKIRPTIDEINMKITPELSLGGFLGGRKRLNRYKPVYLYAPVFTAGVTTIGINSDNTIVEESTEGVKDGLVFARTFSLGSFIEFDEFQVGMVIGWDKAGGEIGKNWIYNDRLWYSFSIGYNFLRRNNEN
nr:hypothetical protein [uncultured Allomuricauda sp.]